MVGDRFLAEGMDAVVALTGTERDAVGWPMLQAFPLFAHSRLGNATPLRGRNTIRRKVSGHGVKLPFPIGVAYRSGSMSARRFLGGIAPLMRRDCGTNQPIGAVPAQRVHGGGERVLYVLDQFGKQEVIFSGSGERFNTDNV